MIKKIILHFFDIIKSPYLLIFLIYKYIFFVIFWFKTKAISNIKLIKPSLEKTFIRWWDWETNAVLWISFSFEKSSKKLKKYLKNIIQYKNNDLLIWLPIKFISNNEKNTKDLNIWMNTRIYLNLNLNLNKNKEYWDALFFRDIWSIENFINFYKWKKLFIVSNKNTINKVNNNIENIWTYEIPYRNSFNNYFNIKRNLLEKLNLLSNKKDLIILVSWWPFAKALCYDLTVENNFICHDIGAIFDIYLK